MWKRSQSNSKFPCSLHLLIRGQHRCFRQVYMHHVVFYFLKYVTWFLEFDCWLLLNFACPWKPLGVEGGDGNGARSAAWLSSWRYVRCFPFLPCRASRSLELPATTEGAAEWQPLARTRGRNLDRGLTLELTPCVGCLVPLE